MRLRTVSAAAAIALSSLGWTAAAAADNPHGTPPGQDKATGSTATASANANAGAKAGGHAEAKETGTTSAGGNAGGHAQAQGQANAGGHGQAHVQTKAHGRSSGKAEVSVGASTSAGAKANGHAAGGAKAKLHVSGGSHTAVHVAASSHQSSHNTVAAATSNQTKVYGNGTTAGQVAVKAGYSGATLYGPGNSRPHKTSPCGKHSVDVHALKANGGACGTAGSSVRIKGHARQHVKVSGHAAAAFAAALGLGIKPSSITGHNTLAAATSNQTKLYGNGKTAGQIAIEAGFGGAMLYGPGNSQPHKVTCGVHSIDVHALKAHAGGCKATGVVKESVVVTGNVSPAAAAQVAVATPVAAATTTTTTATAASPTASTKSGAAPASTEKKESSNGGGVLGTTRTLAAAPKPASQAVLAAFRQGTLPVTGLSLWLPLALGIALIGGGYALRRKTAALS